MAEKWNETSDGFPTHDKPVLVSNGGIITTALAVWSNYEEDCGWVWEGFNNFGSLEDITSYSMDDDYQYDYWMDLPELPS